MKEEYLVVLVVFGAGFFVFRSLWRSLSGKDEKCSGCPGAKGKCKVDGCAENTEKSP